MNMDLKHDIVGKGHCFKWEPGGFSLETKYSQINWHNLIKPLIRNNILKVKLLNEMFLLVRALIYYSFQVIQIISTYFSLCPLFINILISGHTFLIFYT